MHHSLLRDANSVARWNMCAVREDERSHDLFVDGDYSQIVRKNQDVYETRLYRITYLSEEDVVERFLL